MGIALPNSIYQGKPTDGLTITRLLKSDPKTASTPVLLTCGYSMESDGKSFLALSGADAYISQPIIEHQAFVEIVARYAFSNLEDRL
jgi:two-component system, cell cycle response regulator DivK